MKLLDKKKPNSNNPGLINNQPTNTGLVDKNKTKELDLEKDLLNFEISGISWIDGPEYQVDENRLKSFIKTLLTQQRTELLEEIKNGLKDWYTERLKKRGITAYCDDYLDSDDTLSGTIIPIITNLLNKKDK